VERVLVDGPVHVERSRWKKPGVVDQ